MKNKDNINKNLKINLRREPRNLKEVVPLSSKEPRNNIQIKNYENQSYYPQRNYIPPVEPSKLFPIWPSIEEIKVIKIFILINHSRIIIFFMKPGIFFVIQIKIKFIYL